jgi:hypothetical protein
MEKIAITGTGGLVNANVSGANINIDVAQILKWIGIGLGSIIVLIALYFGIKKIFSGFTPSGSTANDANPAGEHRAENDSVLRDVAEKVYQGSGWSTTGSDVWQKISALNNADLAALNNYFNRKYFGKDKSLISSGCGTFRSTIEAQGYWDIGSFGEVIKSKLTAIGVQK